MSLYSTKQTPAGVEFTKFDDDLNIESVSITNGETCDCPAGSRPVCRHRTMFWIFHQQNRVGTSWFYDYEMKEWSQPLGEDEPEPPPHKPITVLSEPTDLVIVPAETTPQPRMRRPK